MTEEEEEIFEPEVVQPVEVKTDVNVEAMTRFFSRRPNFQPELIKNILPLLCVGDYDAKDVVSKALEACNHPLFADIEVVLEYL
jgi:hypothetical protein